MMVRNALLFTESQMGHDLEGVLLLSYTDMLCLGTESTVAVT